MDRERKIALVALIRGNALIVLVIGVRAHETLQNLRIATGRFSLELLHFHQAFPDVPVSSQEIALFNR